MALITRLTRLFRADLHEVLDRLEEPDVLLRQALREMEESIAASTRELKTQQQEHQHFKHKISELEGKSIVIERELDLCFQAANDSLTRLLIRRKLEAEKTLQALYQALAQRETTIQTQNAQLEDQCQRLQTLKNKAAALEIAMTQDAIPATFSPSHDSITEADIDLALLREQQKRRPT